MSTRGDRLLIALGRWRRRVNGWLNPLRRAMRRARGATPPEPTHSDPGGTGG